MRLTFLALIIAAPALAEERKLTGAEIEALLPTIVTATDTTRQTFSAAGATTYTDRGRDSYGGWAARGDQYCSQWPPASGWACYDVIYDAETALLTWIGDSGTPFVTRVTPKN